MFEILLAVASTIIYMKVFRRTPKPKTCDQETQTESWYAASIVDLSSDDETELPGSTIFNVDWFDDEPESELVIEQARA